MGEDVATDEKAEDESPKIVLNRKFWRTFGMTGSKNVTPRAGFFGPNGMPRPWISHCKKEADDAAAD